MKRWISIGLCLACLMSLLSFGAWGADAVFAPYEDAKGMRQYCACGNCFVADAAGTVEYVNGKDGCERHKDAQGNITDGCFIYEREDGGLIMLWSNWDGMGYAIGTLSNTDGKPDGAWEHDETMLYSKKLTGSWDGGHGMIFTDTDGQMHLFLHSPNSETNERKTYPISIPVREVYGTLVWDVWKSE